MALNIVAYRRVSLKGFAEGWDDCYLTVKAMSQSKLEDVRSQLTEDTTDAEGMQLLRNLAQEVIVSGVVINTKDDGSTEPTQFGLTDVRDVVAVLGAGWLQEVLTVASGADRLKAMN